jgi:protein-disulfide isomerase
MSFSLSARLLLPLVLLLGSIGSLPSLARPPKPKPVTPNLEQQVLEIIRKHPEVVIDSIQKYVAEQERKDKAAQAAALQKKRENTAALIGDSPTTGAIDRKIVLVEFSDFQCQFCAQAHANIKQFVEKHKDQVTLVYKHFPLTQIHPEALPAAQAAWAAHKQGKFWAYHDALFTNQKKLGEEFYVATAQNLKLDMAKFNVDRQAANQSIVQDFSLGRQLGVDGTPTFVMNGEFFSGVVSVADLETLLAKVQKK